MNPVPGDLWGGARPAASAFAPAQRTPLPTRDDLVVFRGSSNLCAPLAVSCRIYALKDPSRFTFQVQSAPDALHPGSIGH